MLLNFLGPHRGIAVQLPPSLTCRAVALERRSEPLLLDLPPLEHPLSEPTPSVSRRTTKAGSLRRVPLCQWKPVPGSAPTAPRCEYLSGRGADRKSYCGSSESAMGCSDSCVWNRHNTRKGMASVFADIYFELPEPYFILSASKRYENIPKDHKRCGICQKIIPLSQFHRISRLNPNPRYACIACNRSQNKTRYQIQHRRQLCSKAPKQ